MRDERRDFIHVVRSNLKPSATFVRRDERVHIVCPCDRNAVAQLFAQLMDVLYDRVPIRSEGMPKTVIFPDDARGSGEWSRQFPRLDRQRGSSRLPERSQPELQVGQGRNQPALRGLADARGT